MDYSDVLQPPMTVCHRCGCLVHEDYRAEHDRYHDSLDDSVRDEEE